VKCEIEHLGKNKESRNLRKITLKKDIFKLNVSKCPEVYRGVWAGFRSGVGNLRPAGRIRPAKHFDQAHLI
jgi:hypothetical protein